MHAGPSVIKSAAVVRDLGVMLDAQLTMRDHISRTACTSLLFPSTSAAFGSLFTRSWCHYSAGRCTRLLASRLLQCCAGRIEVTWHCTTFYNNSSLTLLQSNRELHRSCKQTSTIAAALSWAAIPIRPWDIGRLCSLDAFAHPSFWALSLNHASAYIKMSQNKTKFVKGRLYVDCIQGISNRRGLFI